MFKFFQRGDRFYTSESDVYRHRILTYKEKADVHRHRILTYKGGPLAERVKKPVHCVLSVVSIRIDAACQPGASQRNI